MHLLITQSTILKPAPEQARSLPPSSLAPVNKGKVLPVLAYAAEGDHLRFTLDKARINLAELHGSGRNTWYVYGPHCEDPSGYGLANQPTDKPAQLVQGARKGLKFSLPGFSSAFTMTDAIHPQALSFTWAEALHWNGKTYRQPDSRAQVEQIIKMARVLQDIRGRLGHRQITVTSWLRPYKINQEVGGASNSRHLYGDGVDFRVAGMTPAQVYGALDSWWGTQGGLAQGGRMGFTHIDGRGQRARWSYLGA